jgi:hypothetical protein
MTEYQSLSKDGTITGMYLGWIVPDTNKWEALIRLTKSSQGYHLNYTCSYADVISRYKGIARLSAKNDIDREYISKSIPYLFEDRMPRLRVDVERKCELLNLPYPNIDLFAYIARTGGKCLGDSFDICPIVTPNGDGEYELYYLFSAFADFKQYRHSLTLNSKIECDGDGLYLQVDKSHTTHFANLPAYFKQLRGSVDKIEIVNIPNHPMQGMGLFAKVTLSALNPYGNCTFDLLKDKVMV